MLSATNFVWCFKGKDIFLIAPDNMFFCCFFQWEAQIFSLFLNQNIHSYADICRYFLEVSHQSHPNIHVMFSLGDKKNVGMEAISLYLFFLSSHIQQMTNSWYLSCFSLKIGFDISCKLSPN